MSTGVAILIGCLCGIILSGCIFGGIIYGLVVKHRRNLEDARAREHKLAQSISIAGKACRELGETIRGAREIATGQTENLLLLRGQIERARQSYSELEDRYNHLVNLIASCNNTASTSDSV